MAIDFTLSEEQLGLRLQAREFAETVLSQVPGVIAPIPEPLDRFRALKPFYQQMVDAGFVKGLIPVENGGHKFSNLQFALACEELARVEINTPTIVLGTGLGTFPIITAGTSEQKERFLAPFVDAARPSRPSRSPRPPGAPTSTTPTPSTGCRPSPSATATSG